MSPGLIELEVTDFADASVTLGEEVVTPVAAAISSLATVLGGSGGMAGGDPAGLAWARQYDQGAAAVLAASADAANGCGRLAVMFAQTARNWAAAEAASTTGGGSPVLPSLPCVVAVSAFPAPAAAGAGSVGPSGWELIAHLVDCVWPNGHQDRLHRAAEAWDASALVLQEQSDFAGTAAVLAQLHRLPEADDMRTACFAMCDRLRDLASAQRSLAAACRAYAARLDSVHAQVIDELESLVEWSAGIQVVGGLFSVFTAGVAQVPTQSVQASRIAACAARVSELIAGFVASARGLAAALPSVADLADSVALGLRPLLGTRLAVAGVSEVRALPSMTRAARLEMAAESRLAGGGGARIRTFASKPEAREAVPEHIRQAGREFFKKATGKSCDFRIIDLPGGHCRLEYFSRADNPGYGKLYVRVFDAGGRTVERYKDTLGPNGLIETKHLPLGEP